LGRSKADTRKKEAGELAWRGSTAWGKATH